MQHTGYLLMGGGIFVPQFLGYEEPGSNVQGADIGSTEQTGGKFYNGRPEFFVGKKGLFAVVYCCINLTFKFF